VGSLGIARRRRPTGRDTPTSDDSRLTNPCGAAAASIAAKSIAPRDRTGGNAAIRSLIVAVRVGIAGDSSSSRSPNLLIVPSHSQSPVAGQAVHRRADE